jgi:hypothetical protein
VPRLTRKAIGAVTRGGPSPRPGPGLRIRISTAWEGGASVGRGERCLLGVEEREVLRGMKRFLFSDDSGFSLLFLPLLFPLTLFNRYFSSVFYFLFLGNDSGCFGRLGHIGVVLVFFCYLLGSRRMR